MKFYHLIIHGNVQGVGYRYSAESKAKSTGIKGTVRNCTDGTVEIYCHGSEKNMNEFIDFCRNNPGWSKVEEIEKHDIKNKEEQRRISQYSSFEIIG